MYSSNFSLEKKSLIKPKRLNKVTNFRWKVAQNVELRWWKNYLKNKPVDDYTAWKKDYWQKLINDIASLPKVGLNTNFLPNFSHPQTKVLEAGCGPSGLYLLFDQCQVTAIDPLLDSYKTLDHFNPENHPNTTFLAQPLEAVNANNEFDAVFCLNVINHVRDLSKVVQVLKAAAKKGAPVVISVDAHRHALLKPIFKLIPGDILHPHQYNLQEYLDIFENNGLSLVDKLMYKRESIFDYWILIFKSN